LVNLHPFKLIFETWLQTREPVAIPTIQQDSIAYFNNWSLNYTVSLERSYKLVAIQPLNVTIQILVAATEWTISSVAQSIGTRLV
jgi:hypothetical protein